MILSRSDLAYRSLLTLMEAEPVPAPQPVSDPGAGRIRAGAQRTVAGAREEPVARQPRRQRRPKPPAAPAAPTAPPDQWTLSRKQVKGHFNTLTAKNADPERVKAARTALTHQFFGDVNKEGLRDRLHPQLRAVVRLHYSYDPESGTYDREITDDHVRDAIAHLHAGGPTDDGQTRNNLSDIAHQLKKGSRASNAGRITKRGTTSRSHDYDRDDVAAYLARGLDLTLGDIRNARRRERVGRADLGNEAERPDAYDTRGIARGYEAEREQQSFVQKLRKRRPQDAGYTAGIDPKVARNRGGWGKTFTDEYGRTTEVPHSQPRREAQPADTSREDSEYQGDLRKQIRARLNIHWDEMPEDAKEPLRDWIDGIKQGRQAKGGGRQRGEAGGLGQTEIAKKHGISLTKLNGIISRYRDRIEDDKILKQLHARTGLRQKAEESVGAIGLLESLITFAYGGATIRTGLVMESLYGPNWACRF